MLVDTNDGYISAFSIRDGVLTLILLGDMIRRMFLQSHPVYGLPTGMVLLGRDRPFV